LGENRETVAKIAQETGQLAGLQTLACKLATVQQEKIYEDWIRETWSMEKKKN
jgi:hypothetical protein